METRFRNFIFDLDGTLVDSLDGIEASVAHALGQCLPQAEFPALRAHIGPPIATMFRRMFPEWQEEDVNLLVTAFRRHYDESGHTLSRLYPQVPETLAALAEQATEMFVVTNKPLHATRAILRHNRLLDFFREVVSPDSVAPVFPTKIAATEALHQRRNLNPTETVFIGDGADDAAAAEACGFTFIFAEYGYGSAPAARTAKSFASVRNFSEILALARQPDAI